MHGLILMAFQTANNILLISLKYTWSLQKCYTVQWESLAAIMFGESGWMKTLVEVRWMNRLAKRLLIVTINLDGFSLMNHWWFAEFVQTFQLYGIIFQQK